jgi:hypothetical protein
MNNTESNKLIALFMGYSEDEIQAEDWCGCNVLAECQFTGEKQMTAANYHTSWDWLMPVVEKIEGMGYYSWIVYSLYDKIGLSYQMCIGKLENRNCHAIAVEYGSQSKIQTAYQAVLQFIQWFNQHPHLLNK